MLTPSLETIVDRSACAMCGGAVGTTRYAQAAGWTEWSIRSFCSEDCLAAAEREQWEDRWAARWYLAKRVALVGLLASVWLMPHKTPRSPSERGQPARFSQPAEPPSLPVGWFGPEWPPSETSVLAALGRDAWLHPLAGPVRRMPRTDSRVFGAVRPGNRAVECRNGHCGVDLGGEIWGEHVRAVHDGVVDWVQRGPNDEHGGRFVRISHRNGTVYTQYFHLAAIPRTLERGTPVRGGELIGLLGDSGVKESAPHLHFTISIRPSKEHGEKYVDPEPLIALWPLRVPIARTEAGLVTTLAEAGVPLGSLPLRSGRDRKVATKKRGADRRSTVKNDPNGAAVSTDNPAEDDASAGETTPPPEAATDD